MKNALMLIFLFVLAFEGNGQSSGNADGYSIGLPENWISEKQPESGLVAFSSDSTMQIRIDYLILSDSTAFRSTCEALDTWMYDQGFLLYEETDDDARFRTGERARSHGADEIGYSTYFNIERPDQRMMRLFLLRKKNDVFRLSISSPIDDVQLRYDEMQSIISSFKID